MPCIRPIRCHDTQVFHALNAELPDPCKHEICYGMPITLPMGKRRSDLINSKHYLGIFSNENPREVSMFLLAKYKPFNYGIWEYHCSNIDTGNKELILMVTYVKERGNHNTYNTSDCTMQSTLPFAIHPISGRFIILELQRFPRNRAAWYYPLIHYPTFKYLPDLCLYVNMGNYFHYDSLAYIEKHRPLFKPINRLSQSKEDYHVFPRYVENSFFEINGYDYYHVNAKNPTVPKLQDICCSFIKHYTFKNRFDIEFSCDIPSRFKSMISDARYMKNEYCDYQGRININ